jgi:hypothetical protein
MLSDDAICVASTGPRSASGLLLLRPSGLPRLSCIADNLVRWAPTIIGHARQQGPERADEESNLLEDFVYWLRSADRQLDSGELVSHSLAFRRRGHWSAQLGKYFSYRSGFLLECLILSFNLRSASKLHASVHQALRLLPPAWQKSISTILSSSQSTMASAATISRSRLTIDIAYMIYMRRQFESLITNDRAPVCFAMFDSSPQGGRNWLLGELQWIPGAQLGQAADAAREMMLNVVHSGDDAQRHDILLSQVVASIQQVTTVIIHCHPSAFTLRHAVMVNTLHAPFDACKLTQDGNVSR